MCTLKKSLSVFIAAVMLITTFCFFPLTDLSVEAEAAVVNTGNKTAFYVPETIYLYPDVTSWTSAVKTPFQYYVNNTVNTEDIYSAPVADANLDSVGKIYFAAEEGMSDVSLKVKFINLDGSYMNEADFGTVNFTVENNGTYYLITVTDGISPELQASINGCYIEWCLTYKNSLGEEKAMFNYSYVYKPYVVPYGAAARVYNEKGDVNVYGQHITWVTGVHSIDTEPHQTNTLYPYYMKVSQESSTQFAFSPFLSKDNKAYAGGVEVSGSAPVMNGGYNAVFSGTDKDTAYFHAGQTGASFDSSEKVRAWFYTATALTTYPVAFDYMNGSTVSAQYALSQVAPTKIGSITVDISRYDNLNKVPNLGVGMMVVDVDYNDALAGSTAVPISQWYIGDATGRTVYSTGAYDDFNTFSAVRDGVYVKFASAKDMTTPLAKGISYAGTWIRELNNNTGSNTYTLKSYYESKDREGDYQGVSANINLNVNQVDKTELRAAVNRAVSNFGTLGVKENWNSYYYDINYIDPTTGNSTWTRFKNAYINACGVLGNVDSTAYNPDEFAAELNSALDALLSGKGLRVYFDVNHDDIGVNLWINPASNGIYTWNSENETAVINGTVSQNHYYGITPFTPDAASYTLSADVVSGAFSGYGCTVFDAVKEDGSNATKTDGSRYNFDYSGSTSRVIAYEDANFINIEGINFWTWHYAEMGDGNYDNFALNLKIEKGTTKTEYSPAGKVVGTTYGTLPAPEREGYLFAGWCTDESLETIVDASSAVSARILYAKWEKAQYNVVFEGNGATAGEMPEQTMIYDESAVLNTNAYERTGYVFAGWKDADGNYYADGAQVLNLTSEHQGKFTLYAQWTPNQYSVAFDGNTGLGGLGMTNAQYDTPFNLPANYFIKTGYTFMGWATSPDGEVLYTNEQEVSNLTSEVNGSVTLYAVWKANTFTVKFDANTALGEMADAKIVYDSEIALPECGFAKTGYTFIGWSLTADGAVILTDAQYDNLKTEEGDEVTLYAVWSENSYTLSFDKNGGDGANITPTVYGYETAVKLPLNVFTKTGYVLSGWSLTRDGEQVYTNGQEVKHINPDKNGTVTLYAVWTPVNYTVKFDSNSGEGTMESLSMTYDAETVLTKSTFTKEGYHFIGWSTTSGGAVEYTDEQSVRNLTTADGTEVTLYAVWEINTYTVTFRYYSNAGTANFVTTDVKVTHGGTATLPADFTETPCISVSQHAKFSGWTLDITNVTSDITVTAQYPSNSNEDHIMDVSITDSTCAVKGTERHFCTICSYEYFVDIALKAHTWDEGTTVNQPGCLTHGSKVYNCTVCGGTKAEAVSPLGHEFVNFPAKPTTCSEEGNIAHKHCERCEQCFASDAPVTAPDSEALTDEQIKIEKLPHTPGAEADCTTAQVCTVCTEVIKAALGHTEETEYITTDATCTVSGTYTEKVTCTVCEITVSEETKTGTIPHSYEEAITDPDCTNVGYTTFTCSDCGDSYTGNEVPSLGHTEGEWRQTAAPGCVDKGTETNYCSVCGEGFKTREVTATGHDSGEWKVTVPAQCEEWGTESLCCTVCGEVITTRGIQPKGHGETKWEITLEPGCETAGRNSEICVDCNAELRFEVVPEAGHKPNGDATCENDSVCTVCGTLLESHFNHDWDNGTVTKEPTETEEGVKTYTCKNDPSHTKEEAIPVRVVIVLPEIPADGTVDFDAPENGNIGNIHNMITVEDGLGYTVSIADTSVIYMDANGNMTALKDGETVITVKTNDGKFEKSFTAAVRTLKTVIFDVNGVLTTYKAYAGDTVTAPAVDSYVEDGFTYSFKNWTVNGKDTDSFTVTGDMTFVAVFTSSCDYSEIDRLEGILNDVLSGDYDNDILINLNKNAVNTAKSLIEEFKSGRDTRDKSEQARIDAAVEIIGNTIAKIYPENGAYLEIRGDAECYTGQLVDVVAYLMPADVKVTDAVWVSSDDTVGFFIDGKFFAVKTGTVTLTAVKGNLTASAEVTVKGGMSARVIMFDSLLSNANYIVEGTYVITTTTNLFWAPDAPIHFRVITDGTFEEYYVYVNDELVTPDASGTYTIEAGTGDAHVRIDGVVKDESGAKLSFWEMILDFFRRIGEFFRNLFGIKG